MKIGIIGAFDAEVTKLIEMFNMKKEEKTKEIYTATYEGKSLVVARSGIGKVNSAAMTQYLIDKYNVDLIINSGCAGSLTNKVKIMDVVLSSYVTYHDFTPIRIMAMSMPEDGKVAADKKLIELASSIMDNLNDYTYYIDSIASGDSFVTDEITRDRIEKETGCVAVDMESASIGHISKLNNVPFISIRTISDFADGIDDFEELAAHKSAFLVKNMIEKLK